MENSTVPPSDKPCCSVTPTERVLFLVIDAALFLAITFGNILVILSVASYRRLQTPTNVFLASLAVADLLVGFVCLPIDALFGLGLIPTVSPWLCTAGSIMTVFTISASLNHLTVVAYDRFMSITKHLKYGQQMTSRRVVLLIAASWAISALYALMPFWGWNRIDSYNLGYCDLVFIQIFSYRLAGIVIVAFIPIVLMGYMYLRIYRVARQHNRRIAAENKIFNRRGERSLARDLKATKTLAIVLGTFLVAVTPAAIVSVADVVFPVSNLFIYEIVCFHILFCNSAINPITYAFRSREFRFVFIKLLGKILPCKRWQEMSRRANLSLVHGGVEHNQMQISPNKSRSHSGSVTTISQDLKELKTGIKMNRS